MIWIPGGAWAQIATIREAAPVHRIAVGARDNSPSTLILTRALLSILQRTIVAQRTGMHFT
jgi:hypothetical protein